MKWQSFFKPANFLTKKLPSVQSSSLCLTNGSFPTRPLFSRAPGQSVGGLRSFLRTSTGRSMNGSRGQGTTTDDATAAAVAKNRTSKWIPGEEGRGEEEEGACEAKERREGRRKGLPQ